MNLFLGRSQIYSNYDIFIYFSVRIQILTVALGNSYKYPMYHSQRVTKLLLEISREYPQPVMIFIFFPSSAKELPSSYRVYLILLKV